MLECHLRKLKLPSLNNSSQFCLRISTSPTALPPDVKSSTLCHPMFSITLR